MTACQFPRCRVKDLQYGLYIGPNNEMICYKHSLEAWRKYRMELWARLRGYLKKKVANERAIRKSTTRKKVRLKSSPSRKSR